MDEDIRNWLPIDPGFKGIRLPNPIGTNRCYLNSAVNAIFSIPRIDEILNENHPVHAKLKRIKSGLQQSTQVLRQTLNTVFHEGHEYYVKILNMMCIKFYLTFSVALAMMKSH